MLTAEEFFHLICKASGCSLLLYIQTILFQKKIEETYCQYAIFITTWHDVVFHNDNLLERIIDVRKRTRFLYLLFSVRYRQGRLHIILLTAKTGDKVHLKLDAHPLAIFVLLLYLHHSNVHTITTYDKFVVDDVPVTMCKFVMSSSKYWSFNQNLLIYFSFLSVFAFITIIFVSLPSIREIYHGKIKSYKSRSCRTRPEQ